MAIIPICEQEHRKIINARCPYCYRWIHDGEVMPEPKTAAAVPLSPTAKAVLTHHILTKLKEKLDLSRVSDLAGDTLRREIRLVVERLCDTENPLLGRIERERVIDDVLEQLFRKS